MKSTDIPGLYRDESGAIINKDNAALALYKKKKDQNRRFNSLEKKVNELASDINDIKEYLQALVAKTK